MSGSRPRVVFDCNIIVQALINVHGPAGRCLQNVLGGKIVLFASPFVLAEVREIHLKTPAKYGITAEQTDELARAIGSFATILTDVAEIYFHPYDPDDSHYINLAIEAQAHIVVSRDRHLLMLADPSRVEGKDFMRRFPERRIFDPVKLLRELEPPLTTSAANP